LIDRDDHQAAALKALVERAAALDIDDAHAGQLGYGPAFAGRHIGRGDLCAHVALVAAAVLRFATDLRVPFTNNLGEHAIRMPKVKQRISGCFRTLKGAQDFCTIRSYLDTMHKQGHNLFEVLRLTLMDRAPLPASR
jgi:transposase